MISAFLEPGIHFATLNKGVTLGWLILELQKQGYVSISAEAFFEEVLLDSQAKSPGRKGGAAKGTIFLVIRENGTQHVLILRPSS